MSLSNRIVAASLALLLSACAATAERAIVGTWRQTGETRGAVAVEFFNDGTVTARKERASGETIHATGRYAFLGDDRVELGFETAALLAGSTIMRVAISRNELALTPTPNGVTTRYRRIRP